MEETYEDKESLEILEAIHKGASTVDRVVETIKRERINKEYTKIEKQNAIMSFLIMLEVLVIFSVVMFSLFRG